MWLHGLEMIIQTRTLHVLVINETFQKQGDVLTFTTISGWYPASSSTSRTTSLFHCCLLPIASHSHPHLQNKEKVG